MKIIDCSHHQGVIDWKKVKKTVKCVILKATQGLSFVDHTFQDNRNKARKEGILVGAYHFVDGNDAIKEADNFLKTVGKMLPGEFLVLDYEIHLNNPDLWCVTFLDYVFKKTGIKPLIYINSSTANGFSWSKVIKGGYGLWIANYGLNNGKMGKAPTIGKFPMYVLWQYTSRATIEGINGFVDMNDTYLDLETLKQYGLKSPTSPKIEAQASPVVEVIPTPQPIDTTPKQDEVVPVKVTVIPEFVSGEYKPAESWITKLINLFKKIWNK
jgi:GH25 family lysozyme M1 (1,4-beta-N-acetylmuramidase)